MISYKAILQKIGILFGIVLFFAFYNATSAEAYVGPAEGWSFGGSGSRTSTTYEEFCEKHDGTEYLIVSYIDMIVNQYENVDGVSTFLKIMTNATAGDEDESVAAAAIASSKAKEYCDQVADAMKPVGIAIAMLFFLTSLIEFAMDDRLTVESLVKFFAKLAVAIGFIMYSSEICEKINEFGNALAQTVIGVGSVDTSDTYVLSNVRNDLCSYLEYQYTNKYNSEFKLFSCVTWIIGTWMETQVMSLLFLALTVVVELIAFSRIIEIAVRAAFMPIAMGLMADDGWRGAAGRYIKKYLAICCQGAILVLIGMIFKVIMMQTGLFTTAMLFVAMISAMFKSMGLVNDIFGA